MVPEPAAIALADRAWWCALSPSQGAAHHALRAEVLDTHQTLDTHIKRKGNGTGTGAAPPLPPIQQIPHPPTQLLKRERLADELHARIEPPVMHDRVA